MGSQVAFLEVKHLERVDESFVIEGDPRTARMRFERARFTLTLNAGPRV